jgi:xanthine dehydrogenase YagS FAD-binding subunit
MQNFTYLRAASLAEAMQEASQPGTAILAGGTTLVDLMRGDLAWPSRLVDIAHLPELEGFDTSGPVLRFGALARMADVAEDAALNRDYPALAESLRLAASQQIRNAATVAGNLLQRTRCVYFRDATSACNKRAPGTGCAAKDGITRDAALFGAGELCIATYPGDWATALAAFDTSLEIASPSGGRTIPLADLHTPPWGDPAVETTLAPGEIITAILVQPTPAGRRSTYIKVRDRQSYAYAVVSAAVALEMDGQTVTQARVSLGGVAGRPFRSYAAEAAFAGVTLTRESALAAGAAAFADAAPLRDNAFKIELGRRAVAKAALVAAARS